MTKLPHKSEKNSLHERDMIYSGVLQMYNAVCYILLAVGHTFVALLQQQMENADAERDIYDELLTQAEIQGNVNKVNGKSHVTYLLTDLLICLGLHGTVVKC